ncbi:MAG: dephospho-CoA kinase [Anaerovoracaceae bacterium]|jgi:dephospho-CoA kinase
MKVIGLTGGIGSGKTTVSDYLISLGYHVLDADKIAREIVEPGSDALIELVSVFGNEILLNDGSLNRKKLGKIVFSDPEKRKLLNKLMHTRILQIIRDKILQFQEDMEDAPVVVDSLGLLPRNKVIFIDAPLLYETGLDKEASKVWVVDVDDEARINRIMERDGLSREDVKNRIASQMTRAEKNERADEILDNSGERQALYEQIDQLLKKYNNKI